MSMRQTCWRLGCNVSHERCVEIQNRILGHILSSGPPSSAKNMDDVGPANMSRDLPYKKSQLDLRPFGVGVRVVGSKDLP